MASRTALIIPPITPARSRDAPILRTLVGRCRNNPVAGIVLIVWEDVHWSDPTTLESLDLLIDLVPALRVLVIMTFRPEFAPPWIGRPHVTMLNLNRLSRRLRAEMIAHVAGGKTLPQEVAD